MGRLRQVLWRRFICRLSIKVAVLGILFGINIPVNASVATARQSLEFRVYRLRLSLDEKVAVEPRRPTVTQLSQVWNNWPNWGNWRNWANWNNWPNWGNWLNR